MSTASLTSTRTNSLGRATLAICIVCSLGACAPQTLPTPPSVPAVHPKAFTQVGLASWYGNAHAGHRTASGEPFNPEAMTAAHRTLPLGAMVRVTNVENGRSIVVRINDRGPENAGRIIDLSRAAADALGFRTNGTAQVRLEQL
jgi:rare lipoprotein A